MHALMFLMRKVFFNKLKRTFSSVTSAILTILGAGGLGFTLIMAFTVKKPILPSSSAETILAGIVLVMGIFMYNSFLSRDMGILTMADANYLFTGPFEKRQVLAYILISTAPGAILTGFFICFYLPYLLGPALTIPKFLIVIMLVSLMFGCIYLSYYYIYIIDTEKQGIKKKAKYVLLLFVGILAAVFVIMLAVNGFDVKDTAQKYFTHWWYNWIPLFGWTKWAISALIAGDIVYGFIPAAALLVIANTVLCIALYNVKADFYEKTLEDSLNLQRVLDDVKNNGSADARSMAKLKDRISSSSFLEGAASIYSRQMLEYKKVSAVSNMREIFMGLIYVVIGKVFGLEFSFVLTMVCFGALSMSLNDSWHREFKKPYIFLVPASSFQKVIFSVLPGLLKTIVSGGISIIAGGLIFTINPQQLLAYLIIYISFAVLFIFAEVFTYRIIGSDASIMAVTMMRMLFVLVSCIPALIVLIAFVIVSSGYPNLLEISVCMLVVNLASSVLLAFMSRAIFEKSELMA